MQAARELHLMAVRRARYPSFLSTITRATQAFVGDDTFLTTSSQFADIAPPIVVNGYDPHTLSRGNGQLIGKIRRKGALDDENQWPSRSRSTRRVHRYSPGGISGTRDERWSSSTAVIPRHLSSTTHQSDIGVNVHVGGIVLVRCDGRARLYRL